MITYLKSKRRKSETRMASINDLKNLKNKPLTIDDWLNNFTPEERKTVENAILTHHYKSVYKIVANLDENPYPFGARSLSQWANRKKGLA